MVLVKNAWEAVASTPRCILWLDITEEGMGLCCRATRLTPTLSSPFSPLQQSCQNQSTDHHNRWNNIRDNNTIRFLSFKTSETQKHLQQRVSWMSQMYSSQLWAGASLVDLIMFTKWEKQIYAHWLSFYFILTMVINPQKILEILNQNYLWIYA